MTAPADPVLKKRTRTTGFRFELRDRTSCDHKRLDALVSEFDVSERSGLMNFLGLNMICFQSLEPYAEPGLVSELTDALGDDLEVLTSAKPQVSPVHFRAADSMAISYVIAGSRLGTKVLAKRWRASQDAQVLAASRYFTQTFDSRLWQSVCARLDEIPVGSDRAERIVADTCRIYGLFEQVCRDINAQTNRFT